MADVIRRTVTFTKASGVYEKDGVVSEFNDFYVIGYYKTIDSLVKKFRKVFDTKNLVVKPEAVMVDSRMFSMSTNLFISICSSGISEEDFMKFIADNKFDNKLDNKPKKA